MIKNAFIQPLSNQTGRWFKLILGVFFVFIQFLPVEVNAFSHIEKEKASAKSVEIIQLIQHIRKARYIKEAPRSVPPQSYKRLIHVYAKALEVEEKVNRLSVDLGLKNSYTPSPFPIHDLKPEHLLDKLDYILTMLKLTAQKINIKINSALLHSVRVPPSTLSEVYENIWIASFLMDTLTSPINPNFVFRNASLANLELSLIAGKLSIDLTPIEITPSTDTKPIHVNIEAFKALYNIAKLERKLGMKAVRIPEFPHGPITPSDVYDTMNSVLSEISRIKAHIGIQESKTYASLSNKKVPADVFVKVHQLNQGLRQILDQSTRLWMPE